MGLLGLDDLSVNANWPDLHSFRESPLVPAEVMDERESSALRVKLEGS